MLLMVLMAASVMFMLSPGEPMPALKGEFLTRQQALLPGAAYLILLDQRGVVRWRHSGVFDEEAYTTLSKSMSGLLGEPR